MSQRGHALLAALLLTVGCRTYRPAPIELSIDAWRQRPLADAAITPALGRLHPQAAWSLKDGVSLAEAEALALVLNADLRAQRLVAEVPLAGSREAGWLDDPEVGFSLERILEDVDHAWTKGVELSLTIPLWGKLRLEKEAAWAEYTAAWRKVAIAEWQTLRDLNRAWKTWSRQARQQEILSEFLRQLDIICTKADGLVSAGELPPSDARLFAIERLSKRRVAQQLKRDIEQSRLEILHLLGLEPAAEASLVPASGPRHRTPVEGDLADQLRANHLELKLLQDEYDLAEMELQTEVRNQYPDLSLGPGYEREEGEDKLGLGVGLSLPLWNRNRRAIAEEEANRRSAGAALEARWEALHSELRRAEVRLRAAQGNCESLKGRELPLVRKQLEEVSRLMELGEADVLMLLEALTRFLETQLEFVESEYDLADATDELAFLVQPVWITEPAKRDQP